MIDKKISDKFSLDMVDNSKLPSQLVDELFHYGKQLVAKKKFDQATKYFQKCYELDSNHFGACFQLFLQSINKADYESAFSYFEGLSVTNNRYYSRDNNFYLYLLSIITDIPDRYKEYTRNLKFEDIRVDYHDKRYHDTQEQNKIRIAILQGKTSYALKQLNILIDKHGKFTAQDIITKSLLHQVIKTENISRYTLIKLIKNKEYKK